MNPSHSPSAVVNHWRNIPQTTIEALDDFLFWLEYNHLANQHVPTNEELTAVKKLIDEYLQRDQQTIARAEQALLKNWITAVTGLTANPGK